MMFLRQRNILNPGDYIKRLSLTLAMVVMS